VSPSKKANKKDSIKKTRSAQQATTKTSVRSSRVPVKKTQTKSKRTAAQSKANKGVRTIAPAAAMITTPAQVVDVAAPSLPKSSNLTTNILRGLALVAVVAITLYIIAIREHVAEFKQYGYLGIFFVALLANATVFIPAPGVAIIYAMGAVFNPLYVGLVAGTGGAIGELSGFLAGFSGQAIVERTHIYERIKPQVDKYGGWAIFVLAAIPNPFFDVAGFAAGIAKMKLRTFLFSVWVGQLIKMTMFAYAGKYSIEWIANLIK
jgi:uncharacterized membrane protein YdjX (TVP38/TMEM64 family)